MLKETGLDKVIIIMSIAWIAKLAGAMEHISYVKLTTFTILPFALTGLIDGIAYLFSLDKAGSNEQ